MGTILFTTDVNTKTGFREATFDEVIAGARHALAIRVRKGTVMASPKAARDYLTMRLGAREHEVFTILFLDSRHRLIDCLELFRGTIDGASAHPREVVKEALKRNAALAARPQAHVHLVQAAGWRVHGQQVADALGQPHEKHAVVDRLRARRLLLLAR